MENNCKRIYKPYQAHIKRQNIVHSSDHELVVLTGEISQAPSREAVYCLEYPKVLEKEPTVNIRFVPKDQLLEFIAKVGEDERSIPDDFDSYLAPDLSIEREDLEVQLTDDRPGRYLHRWRDFLNIEPSKDNRTVNIVEQKITFETEPEEGAYIFYVEMEKLVVKDSLSQDDLLKAKFVSKDMNVDNIDIDKEVNTSGELNLSTTSGFFTAAVYSKQPTTFPDPENPNSEEEGLTDLFNCWVNLLKKNGLLWFVHPIFVSEKHLNITLADEVIEEMLSCPGLPADLPASDEVLVPLQWGLGHQGIKRIRIDVDPDIEECTETNTVTVAENSFEFDEFIKKVPVM